MFAIQLVLITIVDYIYDFFTMILLSPTHKLQIRSLSLDALSYREAQLLLALGNDRVNRILEGKLQMEASQPSLSEAKEGNGEVNSDMNTLSSNADRSVREEWIRNKYIYKKYKLQRKQLTSIEDHDQNLKIGSSFRSSQDDRKHDMKFLANKNLYLAASNGDIIGVATELANGADLNWRKNEDVDEEVEVAENKGNIDSSCSENSRKGGDDQTTSMAEKKESQTALHAALSSLRQLQALSKDNIKNFSDENGLQCNNLMNCITLLVYNGAKISSLDEADQTTLNSCGL